MDEKPPSDVKPKNKGPLGKLKEKMDDKEEHERPMLNRKNEYRKIDEMLLEGLAEQEEGRPQKLARYMTMRRAIKEKFPK